MKQQTRIRAVGVIVSWRSEANRGVIYPIAPTSGSGVLGNLHVFNRSMIRRKAYEPEEGDHVLFEHWISVEGECAGMITARDVRPTTGGGGLTVDVQHHNGVVGETEAMIRVADGRLALFDRGCSLDGNPIPSGTLVSFRAVVLDGFLLAFDVERAVIQPTRAARKQPTPHERPSRPETISNVQAQDEFCRVGTVWTIRFNGRLVQLKDMKGLRYWAELISRQGTSVSADELSEHGGQQVVKSLGPVEVLMDEKAIKACRSEMENLRREREHAVGDERDELEDRIQTLQTAMARSVDKNGRARRFNDEAERVRKRVAKALTDALNKIREHLPALAKHLEESKRFGHVCEYRPKSPIIWRTGKT